MSKLKLWEQSKDRYEQIGEAITQLIEGIKSKGNESLGIEPCVFCAEYDGDEEDYSADDCNDCPFGEEFGNCGIDEESEWMKSYYLLEDVLANNKEIVTRIRLKITELTNNTELLEVNQCQTK